MGLPGANTGGVKRPTVPLLAWKGEPASSWYVYFVFGVFTDFGVGPFGAGWSHLTGTGPPPGAGLWPGAFFASLESPTAFTSYVIASSWFLATS
jgi:hypothetical protein